MARNVAIGLLLFFGVFAVYGRVAGHDFVRYDDPTYVLENPVVRQGISLEGTAWAFGLHGYAANWHPLTWLSHMLDVELFGLRAGRHHLVSVFWHAAGSVLLFLALVGATRSTWPSAIVAGLFAVHPLRVESVAWIAERKDVLSGFFFMATLCAYVAYARRPGPGRYACVFAALALGVLCKPVLVTLPCVLLLLDLWPLERFRPWARDAGKGSLGWGRWVGEKLPLFGLIAVSSYLTMRAQRAGGAVHPFWSLSMAERVQNAVVSYGTYLWKTLWPAELGVFYPHPAIIDAEAFRDSWPVAAAIAVGFLAVSLVVLLLVRRSPYLFVGWAWFLGVLVPMVGILQVGNQAMADRYAYLPLIGVYLAVVWGVREWAAGSSVRGRVGAGVGLVALLGYGLTSFRLVGTWKDTETLFTHALSVTADNYVAHLNLGQVLKERGELDASAQQFRAALAINRNIAEAHNNLGVVYLLQGELGQAQIHFGAAVRIKPGYAEAYYNLGIVLDRVGQKSKAIQSYREALRHEPNLAQAHNNLGVLLRQEGALEEARKHFEQAVRIRPDYADARRNLAGTRRKL